MKKLLVATIVVTLFAAGGICLQKTSSPLLNYYIIDSLILLIVFYRVKYRIEEGRWSGDFELIWLPVYAVLFYVLSTIFQAPVLRVMTLLCLLVWGGWLVWAWSSRSVR